MARVHGKQLVNPISLSGSFSGSFEGSFDGSGTITSASFAVTASHALFAVSASHEITFEISSSHAQTADQAGNLFGTPSIAVNHITASGNISSSGDIFANDITLNAIGVSDKPNVILKRGSVTGAELKLGSGGGDEGILRLNDFNGLTDILLQGGGISYFSQSLKIGVAYDYPENNPATLTVGGTISASGAFNTLSHITASGNISATGDITSRTGSFNYVSSSGTIEGDGFRSNGQPIAQFAFGAVQLGGATLQPVVLSGTSITLGIAGQNQSIIATSNITASANISASGNIFGNGFFSNGQAFAQFDSGEVSLGGGSQVPVNLTGTTITVGNAPTTFIGNITASGNISASGDIIAKNASFKDSITIREPNTGVGGIIFSNNNDKVYFDATNIVISVDDEDQYTFRPSGLDLQGHLSASGNIQAGGAISASGNIIGNQGSFASEIAIRNGNGSGVLFSQTPDKIYYNNKDIIISLDDSDQYKFGLGGLTSSKAISASGHLAVNDIHANNFRLMTPLDANAGPFPMIKTTGNHIASTAKIFIGDMDEFDTNSHLIIDPPGESATFLELNTTISGSLLVRENATLQGGRPITTHTTSPISSSLTNAGRYHVVGGNLTCSIVQSTAVIGAEYEFFQTSSVGNFLFESASGITVISKNGSMRLAQQGSAAVLKKVNSTTYHLMGDLT